MLLVPPETLCVTHCRSSLEALEARGPFGLETGPVSVTRITFCQVLAKVWRGAEADHWLVVHLADLTNGQPVVFCAFASHEAAVGMVRLRYIISSKR